MKKIVSIFMIIASLNASDIAQDSYTGLTWQDNIDVTHKVITYQKAYEYCQNLELEGFSDWRVPTITELLSLVDYNSYKPAILGGFNFIKDKFYWSSTKYKNNNYKNWGVDFENGASKIDNIDKKHQIRCVRTTKPKSIDKSLRG